MTVIKIIKRGGFREQAARQLKYKDSVNQRTNLDATTANQLGQKSVSMESVSMESVSMETVNQDESSAAKTVQIQAAQNLAEQINVPSNK